MALFLNQVEVEEEEERVERVEVGPEVQLEVYQVVDSLFLFHEQLPHVLSFQGLKNLVYFFLPEIDARLELLLAFLGEGIAAENEDVDSVDITVELDDIVEDHDGLEEDLLVQSSCSNLAQTKDFSEPVKKVQSEIEVLLEVVVGLLQVEVSSVAKVGLSVEQLNLLFR